MKRRRELKNEMKHSNKTTTTKTHLSLSLVYTSNHHTNPPRIIDLLILAAAKLQTHTFCVYSFLISTVYINKMHSHKPVNYSLMRS